MFEGKTIMHAIPANQLYLYYFLLFTLYVLFLRRIKLTYLTATIMLLFNQGFLISLLPTAGTLLAKVMLLFLVIVLLMRARISKLTRKESSTLWLFILFTGLFFLNYYINRISLLWALNHYHKFFIPVALFYAIKGLKLSDNESQYYSHLIIKLLWFQIAFSVVKLLVLGFRENITGSLSNAGGGIGIGYAIIGTIVYWTMRGENLKGKDWWFALLLLLMPIASNKRAIWLLYPIILALLMLNRINKQTLKKIATVILLIPIIIYVGFRFNPSLNPERKLWGSFNMDYAVNYILSYSGASQEKLSGEYAQGRLGAASTIITNTIRDPFSHESLFGYGRTRKGKISDDFEPEDYGLMPGTLISRIGTMIIQMGWMATLLIISVFLRLIYTIPDRKIARIVSFYVLLDIILYSGSMIDTPTQSVLLVLSIYVIKYYSERNAEYSYALAKQGSSEISSYANPVSAPVQAS
ncbi:MAG: hypothetical protein PHT37_06520 [Candidatus Cloacimonetes bacterium]|jgi:hypothetical protein|nr:hypothetical protein [Candidatus Cloacimonadota bacterium]MDD4277523.1 hypothetical protein [Candidatus Cloacimonadota bacterium]